MENDFNQDPTKPAQQVIFSRKKYDSAHPNIFLTTYHSEELHTIYILKYILTK